jgi:hypothetical protein
VGATKFKCCWPTLTLAKPSKPLGAATEKKARLLDRAVNRVLNEIWKADQKWFDVYLLTREVKNTQAWRWLKDPTTGQPFENLSDWIRSHPRQQSSIWNALMYGEKLEHIAPAKLLAGMPVSNAQELVKRINAGKEVGHELIEQATELPPAEFKPIVRASNGEAPEESPQQFRNLARNLTLEAFEEWLEAEQKMLAVLTLDPKKHSSYSDLYLAVARMIADAPEEQLRAESAGGSDGG